MAFVIKTAKTIRNNWKKSVFFAIVVSWGGSYTKNYIDIQNLMRSYCERANSFGTQTIPVRLDPRTITVILNPNANKRKAQSEFDKYCAPLLHLAGINVEMIKTESEGHAKELMTTLGGTEAIIVAGGDGTLSEVVTGLLRRTNEQSNSLVPIGILPLGRNNTVGKFLFPGENKLGKVKALADATMAIIEELTKEIDVMKIEILNEETKKPVYAIAGIKWGAYRDAECKKDSYWYFGNLKKYYTYLLNGLKTNLNWNCEAELLYSPPCSGCSNCYKIQQIPQQPKSKWFQSFVKDTNNNNQNQNYQRINNPYCKQKMEKKVSTTDLMLLTSNIIPKEIGALDLPKLNLFLGPKHVDYFDFVKQGWKSEKGETREINEIIEARTIELNPINDKKTIWFSIDNEDFEVKPIRVTLLPKIIKMYCTKQ